MTLGENIKRLRQKAGLTQQQLASKLFISRQTISKWETGLAFPQVTILKELTEILKCSYEELLDVEEIN